MPNNAPVETWVVETGIPCRLAVKTSAAVTRLPPSPCTGSIWVKSSEIVLATRRERVNPPTAMPQAISPTVGASAVLATVSAAILGASLRPRANPTAPADR